VNARIRIRRILFGVFALNWIMKPNPSEPLSYIFEHHMFDKNTKLKKEFYFCFCEICYLIEL